MTKSSIIFKEFIHIYFFIMVIVDSIIGIWYR